MKHNIKLDFDKSCNSCWEDFTDEVQYCKEVKEIDILSKEYFINEMVKEFKNTDSLLLPIFKEKLSIWIDSTDDNEIQTNSNQKVRDFIYEMF